MKADINEDGLLTITAQSGLEAYAIMKWFEENMSGIATKNIFFTYNSEKIKESWKTTVK